MKVKLRVKFHSGRETTYEIDFWGGAGLQKRLDEFVACPDIVLRTSDDIVVIPRTAIEQVWISLPDSKRERAYLSDVRQGEFVK